MAETVGQLLLAIFWQAWIFLREAAIYILFGIAAGGLMKAFLPSDFVASHLGRGKFLPVLKASLLGVPLPLCSCGVVPAASTLKKQGANTGAAMAFLIATPESGVDSISISYALLDPILTVARPVAAFLTAMAAGILGNFFDIEARNSKQPQGMNPSFAGCDCDGGCSDRPGQEKEKVSTKIVKGMHFAVEDLWADIAGWFFLGVLLAGVIAAVLPDDLVSHYLGGGLSAMLFMLAAGIPMYICATASTPIAAALILKGISPGTALVFLLAGPATNMMTLSVLLSMFGRKATAVYLVAIALVSVLCGVTLDWLYRVNGLSAKAMVGQAGEVFPDWLELAAVFALLLLTARMLYLKINRERSGKDACGCGKTATLLRP